MVEVSQPEGVVTSARQLPSPHRDARPARCGVELVVLHGISLPPGRFGGPWIERLFTGTLPRGHHPYLDGLVGVRVSSHLLITRSGDLIQFVPLGERAWHAGPSRFADRERCNDFAIGIELEGCDDIPYTPSQYACLVPLLNGLFAQYPGLGPSRVTGHEHIAPGRKNDPGPAFDWAHLGCELGVPAPRIQSPPGAY